MPCQAQLPPGNVDLEKAGADMHAWTVQAYIQADEREDTNVRRHIIDSFQA